MKENKYDDPVFFDKYSGMARSVDGLRGAGEWATLKEMLPDLQGKRLLDLGCGFGWHCIYAMEQGAESAVGIDISEKMLERARIQTKYADVSYLRVPMEDMNFEPESFDVVLSSLALHYTENFAAVVSKVCSYLKSGGEFIFSVEHPIFTAYGSQDWIYDAQGKIAHFPVDRYSEEGKREAVFLGEKVTKYHRTLTTYLNTPMSLGFRIAQIVEPMPTDEMLRDCPAMRDELRRPMMLIVRAVKL